MGVLSILIAIILLVVSLACLWYFIKTLLIIFRDSPLLGVIAVLFSPIGHIIWYLSNKQKLLSNQRQDFKRFFISYVLLIIASLAFMMIFLKAVPENTITTVSPAVQVS